MLPTETDQPHSALSTLEQERIELGQRAAVKYDALAAISAVEENFLYTPVFAQKGYFSSKFDEKNLFTDPAMRESAIYIASAYSTAVCLYKQWMGLLRKRPLNEYKAQHMQLVQTCRDQYYLNIGFLEFAAGERVMVADNNPDAPSKQSSSEFVSSVIKATEAFFGAELAQAQKPESPSSL